MTAAFYIAGAMAVATALGSVLARDPLRAALSLIVCFLSLAVLYVLLSAQFVAAIQIIVYAGAIMVFFVIVIMMLDPGRVTGGPRILWILLGLAGAGLIAALLIDSLAGVPSYGGDVTAGFGTTEEVGMSIFRRFILPFEVLSFLLLAAMIGAVVLTRKDEGLGGGPGEDDGGGAP